MPRALLILLAFALALSPTLAAKNRLADAQSPYLLQHADNPVNWYPWGDEAFAAAQAENKLVLVSIGYSTCHWCHVMNRESFSDPEIAAYLNSNYICIKVDREERPDVDSSYMAFVVNLTGSGGWPLNVWLTPDKKPVFGGTYFPPRSEPGHGQGFLDLLQEIHGFWESDAAAIEQRADQIVQALDARNPSSASDPSQISFELVSNAIAAFYFQYDSANAGFDSGAKFPSPTIASFLLRAANIPELPAEDRQLAKRIALETLDAIARGGLRDHLGGGFHRYTVDPQWQLPHFEKMLYDQALLAEAFVDAWQLTGEARYRDAATDTLDYLLRDMRHRSGAFFSAEDAESADPESPDAKREGAYYLWTTDELEKALPDPRRRSFARRYYSIEESGNAPAGDFPTQIFSGYNTLRVDADLENLAAEFGLSLDESEKWVHEIDSTLFQLRQSRPRPHVDDKLIAAWNGLAISAFARAAQAFERPDYADAAAKAASFIYDSLYHAGDRQLSRLYRDSVSEVAGVAEDYAFLIDGLIDLYEATADPAWLQKAHTLQAAQIERFHDPENGGFFLFENSDDLVFQRGKRRSDSALPNPNSVSAKNLSRLAQFFDDQDFQQKAQATVAAFIPRLVENSTAMPGLLEAFAYVAKKPLQIVIAGDPQADDVKAMLRLVNQRLLPSRCLLYADQGRSQNYLGAQLEFIRSATAYDGKATAYVCENYVCQLPTDDPEQLRRQLDDRLSLAPKSR